MRLAEDHTSYVRPSKAGDGDNAIKHLTQEPALATDDGGGMLKRLVGDDPHEGPAPWRVGR